MHEGQFALDLSIKFKRFWLQALLDRGDEGASLMAPLKFHSLWWLFGGSIFVGEHADPALPCHALFLH